MAVAGEVVEEEEEGEVDLLGGTCEEEGEEVVVDASMAQSKSSPTWLYVHVTTWSCFSLQ